MQPEGIRELIFYLPVLFLIIIPFIIRLVRQARKKRKQADTGTVVPKAVAPSTEVIREQPKIVQIKNSRASVFPPFQPPPPEKPSSVPPRTVAIEALDFYRPQKKRSSPLRRLESLSPLRRAVLWAEILGPARGRGDAETREW